MKRKILNKKNIILSSVGFAIISGAGVLAYNVNQPVNQPVSVVEESGQEVVNAEKVEKVELKEPKVEIAEEATVPVQPVEQAAPVVQTPPETATATYKWAAEMAAAGIAESDYDIVTKLLLDDSGWVFTGRNAWYKASECWAQYRDLTGCLLIANNYVKGIDGTWDNAVNNWWTVGKMQDRHQANQ